MKLTKKILCTVFISLVFFSCHAPRRALITIGTSKEKSETLAKRQKQDNNHDRETSSDTRVQTSNQRVQGSVNTYPSAFDLGYKSIIDRETGYKWEPYADNPTSLLRFLMEDQSSSRRLPSFEELTYFFDKLGSELRTNRNGEIANQIWLQLDGDYISSTEVYTTENKRLYRGVSWSYSDTNYKSVSVASGDLVNIILVTPQ